MNLSRENLQYLIDAFEIIASSLDSKEVLNRIMNQAAKLTGAEAASIFIIDEATSELQLKVATNLNEEKTQKISTPIGEGLVGYVAQTGKLINLSNAQNDSRFYRAIDLITGITTRSCLTVPLIVENKIVGATQVLNKAGGKNFSQEDELLLTEFSRLASVTLNKSWLHEQIIEKKKIEADLEIARSIQNKLLPDKELIQNNFVFNGFYKPAQNIGGDYFDYYPLSANEVFFTVGDVSGKGAQASILMASVKSFLSASLESSIDFAAIVFRLNNFFFLNSPLDKFITMFLGILNTENGNLAYINAGHEPPIIIRNSNEVEELKSNNFMLGALDNLEFKTSESILNAGDILFVYTDGVTEAKSKDKKYFGLKNLIDQLTNCKNERMDFIKIIPEKLNAFTHLAEQSDDITFMIIK